MSESTIPSFVREAGERGGKKTYLVGSSLIDEDELKALLVYGKEAETEHTLTGMLGESWVGLDVQRRANAILKQRGIAFAGATQEQMLDALRAAS